MTPEIQPSETRLADFQQCYSEICQEINRSLVIIQESKALIEQSQKQIKRSTEIPVPVNRNNGMVGWEHCFPIFK